MNCTLKLLAALAIASGVSQPLRNGPRDRNNEAAGYDQGRGINCRGKQTFESSGSYPGFGIPKGDGVQIASFAPVP
jgi:hypothetical protein